MPAMCGRLSLDLMAEEERNLLFATDERIRQAMAERIGKVQTFDARPTQLLPVLLHGVTGPRLEDMR